MKIPAYLSKIGKTPFPWLLEALLIVISVALGFWVAQLKETRDNRELAGRVLNGLQAEVEHNLALVEPHIILHGRWSAGLNEWLGAQSRAGASNPKETAKDVFIATWPDINPKAMKPPFPTPRRGAWDAALSTGALRLIDYDVVAGLSEIYQWQDALESAVQVVPYNTAAFFDPASRMASVQQVAFAIEAIGYTEGFLVAAYKKHLPAIRAAAAHGR